MKRVYTSAHADASIAISDDGVVEIVGQVHAPEAYESVTLLAASPPTRGVSYAGSALPFPCPQIAFENTPNQMVVPQSGAFSAKMWMPNAYYSHDGIERVPPSIFLTLRKKGASVPVFVRFELPDRFPLRTLTHRKERTGPDFYTRKADAIGVRGQFEIMQMLERVKVMHGTG